MADDIHSLFFIRTRKIGLSLGVLNSNRHFRLKMFLFCSKDNVSTQVTLPPTFIISIRTVFVLKISELLTEPTLILQDMCLEFTIVIRSANVLTAYFSNLLYTFPFKYLQLKRSHDHVGCKLCVVGQSESLIPT